MFIFIAFSIDISPLIHKSFKFIFRQSSPVKLSDVWVLLDLSHISLTVEPILPLNIKSLIESGNNILFTLFKDAEHIKLFKDLIYEKSSSVFSVKSKYEVLFNILIFSKLLQLLKLKFPIWFVL